MDTAKTNMVASFGAINLQNGGWKCLQMRRSVEQSHTFIHLSVLILFHMPLLPVYFYNQQAANTQITERCCSVRTTTNIGLRATFKAGRVNVLKGDLDSPNWDPSSTIGAMVAVPGAEGSFCFHTASTLGSVVPLQCLGPWWCWTM